MGETKPKQEGEAGDPLGDLVITLLDDPELKIKLENKLKEYGERVAKKKPEEKVTLVNVFKSAILERVLQNGQARMGDLMVEYGVDDEESRKAFSEATMVIFSYVNGLFVRGGTGLK